MRSGILVNYVTLKKRTCLIKHLEKNVFKLNQLAESAHRPFIHAIGLVCAKAEPTLPATARASLLGGGMPPQPVCYTRIVDTNDENDQTAAGTARVQRLQIPLQPTEKPARSVSERFDTDCIQKTRESWIASPARLEPCLEAQTAMIPNSTDSSRSFQMW